MQSLCRLPLPPRLRRLLVITLPLWCADDDAEVPMNAKPRVFAFGACLVAALTGASFRAASDEPAPAVWSKQAAANYLDARQTWWMHWPKAARDHDTFCVSCHTVVTYLLACSALRSQIAQPSLSPTQHKIINNGQKRAFLLDSLVP